MIFANYKKYVFPGGFRPHTGPGPYVPIWALLGPEEKISENTDLGKSIAGNCDQVLRGDVTTSEVNETEKTNNDVKPLHLRKYSERIQQITWIPYASPKRTEVRTGSWRFEPRFEPPRSGEEVQNCTFWFQNLFLGVISCLF